MGLGRAHAQSLQCAQQLGRGPGLFAHDAQDLINSVPHSTAPKPDPVANQMRREYRSLAGSETGVRGLLEDYIAELNDMIHLIEDTRRAYSAGDLSAVAQLRGTYGEGS